MPGPLEQLLTQKYQLRYADVRKIVLQGRKELGLPARGPWTQELHDLCMQKCTGENADGNKNAESSITKAEPKRAVVVGQSDYDDKKSTKNTPLEQNNVVTSESEPEAPKPMLKKRDTTPLYPGTKRSQRIKSKIMKSTELTVDDDSTDEDLTMSSHNLYDDDDDDLDDPTLELFKRGSSW
eukprot:CAMPEP_0198146346 /NCGR_PEP_ID=MMETSP1443-20131203/28987_1 /TAXON_ID=186043 /ORGANISM="Entomoneis sp., Strain CCMP2396" /LENGTH=180 /DNA_ID=CAMNT_0043810281 /DNA_START=121 /DNA_END=660 /DNA_ORIENTATION=-